MTKNATPRAPTTPLAEHPASREGRVPTGPHPCSETPRPPRQLVVGASCSLLALQDIVHEPLNGLCLRFAPDYAVIAE